MRRVFATVSVIALAYVCTAQDSQQPAEPQQQGVGERVSPRGQDGGRRGGPGGMGRGMMFGGRGMGRMVEELNLDEEQQKVFDELMAPMRERMRAQGERWRAAREAADAGDDTQLKALQAEMEASRGGGQGGGEGRRGRGPGGPGGMNPDAFAEILEQLEPHLRPDQVEKLDDMRDRMDRDRETMDAWRRLSTDLPEQLKLDEEQSQQFNEMLNTARQSAGERWAQMRPIFEEMQKAREENDTERLAQLRQQMEEARPDQTAQVRELLAQVESILRDDQKPALEDFRHEAGISASADDDAAGTADVRGILRVAKRLRLDSDQKEDLRLIERQALRSLKSARDYDAKTALAERVTQQIERMLDDTQAQRFHQQVERLSRRSRR